MSVSVIEPPKGREMTNKEAINLLINAEYADKYQGNEDLATAQQMAIDSLKQESVAKERYQDLCNYFRNCEDCGESILHNKEEFKAWLERMYWQAIECDKLVKELDSFEPCEDCVSRQDVFQVYCVGCEDLYYCKKGDRYCDDGILLDELPSVRPERKKGEWIPQDFNKSNGFATTAVYYFPKCSVCGETANYTNYCPNCGSYNGGEQNEV